MGIDLDWCTSEETVIHWRFHETWTADELLAAVKEVNRMMESKSSSVMLLEIRGPIPGGIITRLPAAKATDTGKVRLVVCVGVHQAIRQITQLYQRILDPGMEMVYFDTMAEARAYLKREKYLSQ